MTTYIRTSLILAMTLCVAFAYSPSALADKKSESNSNSNSDDKKKEKEKEKDNDGDQNSRSRGRSRSRDDDQSSGTQQIQNAFQGNSSKQGKSGSSQQSQGNPQFNQFQKSQQGQSDQKQKLQQFQNLQKQNNPQINLQKQNNFQQQDNKNKWQKQSHHNHKDLNNWVVQFGGPKPFTEKWYKDHPKAWHHKHHHDHDDDWKVVTAAGVVGFLGWQAYQQRPVVIYEPVPYDTLFVSRPGVVVDPARGDWMPLGVFSLMVGPGDASSRMLDLAVDRHGHIRGSYYDMISGASYNVAGIIDQRTQYAQWSLESNRQLTFFTPIGEMLQPQGVVNVRLPSGQRQEWQLVRMESEN